MCGIFGVLGVKPDREWVQSCANSLHHRGPDNTKIIEVSNQLTLGSTRLAMVDPHPRSNQPMIDSDSGDVLCLNGEIFNYQTLKKNLELNGVDFKTESDTEVMLKLLSSYGIEVVKKLQGMFAFVFFSETKQKLYLGRDTLGKKPLYFRACAGKFYWSSEIGPLRDLERKLELNKDSLIAYLSLGYSLDPNTIYEEIKSVKPGEIVEISTKSLLLASFRTMPVDHSNTSIEKDLVKSIDNAILRRIEGHTNVALSLSGGFDSSLIAYRLKKLDIPFTAFTAFWRDSDKDRYNEDARVAEEFCKKIGVPLERIEMPATAEIPNLFVEVQRICGEPISNPTSISMVRLYRDIARSGYRLVLTGDGSDEIFGGYQRHVNTRKFKNLLNVGSYATDFLASGAFPSIPRNLRLLLSSQLSQPKLSLDLFWHEIFSLSDISQLLSLPKIHVYKSIRMSIIENLKNFKGNKNNVSAIMNFDRAIWLSMESNRKLDRISMHNSIEARSPFQDDLLILLAGRLMEDSNYRNLNKDLLRKQFKQLHALGVRDDKAGFTSPLGHWIRKNQDFFQVYVEKAEVALEIPKRLRMSIDFAKLVQKREYRINQKIWTLATLGIFLDEPRLEIEKSY